MVIKLETIKKREDFLAAAANGEKILGDFFILQARKKESQSGTRFGFTVTKKTAKQAVIRNRMKRRLREAVRRLESVNSGYDVVLIVRQRMITAPFKVIEASLRNQLAKAGI